MNKAAVIGAITAVVIGIVIVSYGVSMDSSVEDEGSVSEDIVMEESIPIEEPVVGEGRDLSVEFNESINLKTP